MTALALPRESLSLYRAGLRLRAAALRGDPVASVLCMPKGRDGSARYERIRERGELVQARRGLLMSASYGTCGELLRSDSFGVAPSRMPRRALANDGRLLVHPLDDSFTSLNPPEHTRLRKIVAPWFTPRALRDLRPFIEDVVAARLDRLDRAEPFDLVREFAARVPSRVICDLLGLPDRDHDRFVHWGIEFGAVVDGVRTPRDLRRMRTLLREMSAYFAERLARRRGEPAADVLGRLAQVAEAGELDLAGAVATAEALLIGGFVTTANVIGSATLALVANPDQREMFVADPEGLAGNAVEETLRLESPAQYSVRFARAETMLAGRRLGLGTPVVALLAAANRDPAAFPEPDRFDLARPNARKHLAFAAGIHYCIGAGLARMEGEIALRALFERFPRIRLAGRVRSCPSRVIRGPMVMPVRVR